MSLDLQWQAARCLVLAVAGTNGKSTKGAFLIGKVSQTIRSAWSLFTPCMAAASLLEAVAEAARNATSGDVVLLSPACSGLDQFRNYQHRGQVFCEAVKSIGRGHPVRRPHTYGVPVSAWSLKSRQSRNFNSLLRFFLRKNPEAKN